MKNKNMQKYIYYSALLISSFFWLVLGCGPYSGAEGNIPGSSEKGVVDITIESQDGSMDTIKIDTKPVVRDSLTNKGKKERKSKSPFSFQSCCNNNIQPCCCDSVWAFYERMLGKNNIKECIDIKGKDPYFHVCDSTFESFRRQIYLLDSMKFGQ